MKTTSFLQDQKHLTKSDRFQPIKPELIETILKPRGFNLVSLKTGKAKLADREAFQTTIARYRSQSEMKIGGHYLDIVAKVPHLYGAPEFFLGTFRVVCGNGAVVGVKFFSFKVKHLGDPKKEIETLIPTLVAQEQAMVDTIKTMQDTSLSEDDQIEFAHSAAVLRMAGIEDIDSVATQDLLIVNRDADSGTDLYTIFNRIQEGLIRNRMRYTLHSTRVVNGNTESYIRNATTRPIGERSVRSVQFNQQLWDLATSYIKAA